MPYLVRYAGERFGKYRPITRERIIADLRMWMCPKEVCNTVLRIAKGQKVRTRAATYCYTEEPRPTEEEYRERLRDAVSNRTPTFGTKPRRP